MAEAAAELKSFRGRSAQLEHTCHALEEGLKKLQETKRDADQAMAAKVHALEHKLANAASVLDFLKPEDDDKQEDLADKELRLLSMLASVRTAQRRIQEKGRLCPVCLERNGDLQDCARVGCRSTVAFACVTCMLANPRCPGCP